MRATWPNIEKQITALLYYRGYKISDFYVENCSQILVTISCSRNWEDNKMSPSVWNNAAKLDSFLSQSTNMTYKLSTVPQQQIENKR